MTAAAVRCLVQDVHNRWRWLLDIFAPAPPPFARTTGSVHVSMLLNPSHLEAVDPVVMGKIRAKQLRGKGHCVLYSDCVPCE